MAAEPTKAGDDVTRPHNDAKNLCYCDNPGSEDEV